MTELNVIKLVDEDLAPVLARYRHLASFLASDDVEAEQVALFFEDNNQRLAAIVDRLAGVANGH